jgi:hypothetical protein
MQDYFHLGFRYSSNKVIENHDDEVTVCRKCGCKDHYCLSTPEQCRCKSGKTRMTLLCKVKTWVFVGAFKFMLLSTIIYNLNK